MISRTMHSLAYDSVHDEIVVNSPLAQAILMFRGAANGEEPPLRVIQGPHTQIQGTDYDGNDKMTFDEVHGEVYLPVAGNKVLVFSREANGDVAPLRVLGGPDTQIRGSVRGHALVGVDPINNLLIVGSTGGQGGGRDEREGGGGRGRGALVIFDRTASGNATPRAVIQGPHTSLGGVGQIQTYPPKGWIIAGAAGEPLAPGAFMIAGTLLLAGKSQSSRSPVSRLRGSLWILFTKKSSSQAAAETSF